MLGRGRKPPRVHFEKSDFPQKSLAVSAALMRANQADSKFPADGVFSFQ